MKTKKQLKLKNRKQKNKKHGRLDTPEGGISELKEREVSRGNTGGQKIRKYERERKKCEGQRKI